MNLLVLTLLASLITSPLFAQNCQLSAKLFFTNALQESGLPPHELFHIYQLATKMEPLERKAWKKEMALRMEVSRREADSSVANLSAAELANNLQMSEAFFVDIIKGQNLPPFTFFFLYGRFLNTSPSQIMALDFLMDQPHFRKLLELQGALNIYDEDVPLLTIRHFSDTDIPTLHDREFSDKEIPTLNEREYTASEIPTLNEKIGLISFWDHHEHSLALINQLNDLGLDVEINGQIPGSKFFFAKTFTPQEEEMDTKKEIMMIDLILTELNTLSFDVTVGHKDGLGWELMIHRSWSK